MKEAGMEDLYRMFFKAINEGRLIEKNGAYEILQSILAQPQTTKDLASELKFTLSSKLMTDVTKVINAYLHAATNNNNYTYNYFTTAATKLRLFQELADTSYYNMLDVTVNRLFLEGHAHWRSYKTADMLYSLAKVDSALALKPQAAYLYNLKGLMHVALRQHEEAKAALRKGISLAPNWLYPYHNLASALAGQNKFDSAMIYYEKALALDTNYQTTYGGISVLYNSRGMADSAAAWATAGLKKDPNDPALWAQLGYTYLFQKDYQKALPAFYNSIHLDSNYVYGNEGVLRVHMYDYKSEDSVKYYVTKLITADSLNPIVYQSMGAIFNEFKEYNAALDMLNQSVMLDSLNPDTWRLAATSYSGLGNDSAAINMLNRAWVLDSTDANIYNQMANAYFNLSSFENAQYLFMKAIQFNPQNAVLHCNYGMALEWGGDKVNAEKAYLQSLQKDPNYSNAYYQLATLYAGQGKIKEAVQQLALAIKHGSYTLKAIETDSYLEPLRNDKGYKALLKKLQ